MSYSANTEGLTKITLNETDTAASILQNIAIILATPKGSIPMAREFGVDTSFLDRPLPEAQVLMTAPIREAVERWEPRARVTAVSFDIDPNDPGKLIPRVEVEFN